MLGAAFAAADGVAADHEVVDLAARAHADSRRRILRGPVAQMVFQTHDGFSFPGTSLRVAFSSSIRAGLGQYYYPEQLQTM